MDLIGQQEKLEVQKYLLSFA